MGSAEGEDEKIPEFFIFDRIDELERISLELMEDTGLTKPTLKQTQLTAKDALILAEMAFILTFAPYYEKSKKLWGAISAVLKTRGMSEDRLTSIKKYLDRMYKIH